MSSLAKDLLIANHTRNWELWEPLDCAPHSGTPPRALIAVNRAPMDKNIADRRDSPIISSKNLGIAWGTTHDVHFYPTDESLIQVVGEFLSEGVRAGQPLVVIATAAHRRAFEKELLRMHPDLDAREAETVWLDARDTLASFMEGPMPNAELFQATVGNVFSRLMASRTYLVIRAYGEMVDLLWQEGNQEGAIALEKLWNALAHRYAFSLLCAYNGVGFEVVDSRPGYYRVCAMHERVWQPSLA